MTFFEMLNTVIILPLKYFFEFIYMTAYGVTSNPGLSIIVLSLIMNILVLPLYRRADAMQKEERNAEAKLSNGVAHIKKTFKGDEKMMILQTYYRQNHYSPMNVFKGAASLMLEIPFFIAAYQFLSNLDILRGVSFGPIANLGVPDALLQVGSLSVNLLPIIMTAVNLVSCLIFTRDYPRKTKIQLYSMAVFFLFFLYDSPAGLVFYWTLNNVFSLVKTIFYNMKNTKRTLTILTTVSAILLFIYALTINGTKYQLLKLKFSLFSFLLLVPPLVSIFHDKYKFKSFVSGHNPSKMVFYTGALFLTVLTGILIPSSVLASSPQEFVSVYAFIHPLRYLLFTGLLAAGTFLGWIGVFYALATDSLKTRFEAGLWVVCGMAALNYMCFDINFGDLSNTLVYTNFMSFTSSENIMNGLAILGLAILFLLIFKFKPKLVTQLLLISLLAFSGMSIRNIINIKNSVQKITVAAETNNDVPSFTLSKSGKNVIVLMLDRSLNDLFPYLIEEKPVLKDQFAGFTYYPNTISFGAFTNFATPALFGGYEYTPYELNIRDDELLVDKQNEALKVMPVVFDQNDYNVTVIEPTYANYQWVPDLSIYKEYPKINAYNINGRFTDNNLAMAIFNSNKRNFFFYSLMKISPICTRSSIYDYGKYKTSYNRFAQIPLTTCTAKGESQSFLNAYSVLEHMEDLTVIDDSSKNTFLLMTNDTTHDVAVLQQPDYTPEEYVDNTPYESDDYARSDASGDKIYLDNFHRAAHYDSNMAALLKIGKWLDYLRENNVYDNTRIIIVGDHGRDVGFKGQYIIENTDDSLYYSESYWPLLLVKDFDSTLLTESTEFMTNADVPSLAMSNLIVDPVNPFTHKSINSNSKNKEDQYVFGSMNYSIMENNGTHFLPGIWFSVHDDCRDINNWKILQTDSVTPFSEKRD